MDISYPMIAKACSDNDTRSEQEGMEVACARLHIDLESMVTAAQQRVMRLIYLLIRRQPPQPGKPFVYRQEAKLMTEREVAQIMSATWIDAFAAGVACEKKRAQASKGAE